MRDNSGQSVQAAIISTLRQCRLFAGLPPADLQSVAEVTVVKKLAKGEYLFREGDPAHGFYIVQRGAVNVHRVSTTGREQVIHVFRAGESFAEVAVAIEMGYPADARAAEPTQVLLVRKDGMIALLRRKPELALRMLGAMSAHLRTLVWRLEDLTLKGVGVRLANWLLKHCPNPQAEQPVRIELTITKSMLPAELGTVSETLSRTLAKFREQNLLSVKGPTITMHSPAKLNALLQRSPGG